MSEPEETTQNNTIQHQGENSLVGDLSKPQIMAVVWRTEGLSFQEIASNLNISIHSVKNWFRRGTSVYGVYKDHSSEIAYQLGIDAILRTRMLAEKATKVLEESLDKKAPPNTRLKSAVYILEKTTEMTLKEKEEREMYPYKYEQILSIMGLKPEDFFGENKGEAMQKFDYYMGLMDEANKLT